MDKHTIQILSNKPNSCLLFDTTNSLTIAQRQSENIVRDFMDEEYYSKEWDCYLDTKTECILEIEKNWDNISFFENKFDELKAKEVEIGLTDFEKQLLYEIIDPRLLAFPKGPENSFFPDDYKQLIATKNEYKSVVSKFNKQYKNK